MSAPVNANRYELHSRTVSLTYGDAGIDGKPYLNYVSAEQNLPLSFKGDELRVIQNTDVGKVVSVTIRRTIDAGSTSFTILVPRTMTAKGQSSAVKTVGITTLHRFSVVPKFTMGQDDIYTTVELSGIASVESHP